MDTVVAEVSKVDITGLEVQLLTAFGIALLAVATAAMTRLTNWLGMKNIAGKQAAFEGAADAALEYGIARATETIQAHGWGHVEVKNQVLATASAYAIKNFGPTLKSYGIEVDKPQEAGPRIAGLLERRYSGAISKAAVSPATPPTDSEKPTLATNATVVSK